MWPFFLGPLRQQGALWDTGKEAFNAEVRIALGIGGLRNRISAPKLCATNQLIKHGVKFGVGKLCAQTE